MKKHTTKPKPVAPQSLGERIAQARRLLGVQERADVMVPDLAKRVGVTAASLYNWESDGAVPSEANLIKLARVLTVSPAYLRYGIKSEPEDEGHDPTYQRRPIDPGTTGTGAMVSRPKKQA